MKEVVQVEVIKLLDAGIIYSISNSSWVNPMKVVPKRRGMIVVSNEKNELILTKIVTMESVYRLPETERHHAQGSFFLFFHRLDA